MASRQAAQEADERGPAPPLVYSFTRDCVAWCLAPDVAKHCTAAGQMHGRAHSGARGGRQQAAAGGGDSGGGDQVLAHGDLLLT
jgi:hypothetical protein